MALDSPGCFAATGRGGAQEERGMSGLGWVSFLIVGLIAGWAAEKLMQRDHSLIENLVVGVIGAYLGAFLFRLLGLTSTGFIGALVVAIVGSVVLLAIVGAVRKRR
jgi:uncharacterized membrane protein YeaQ/YmgE (transglycosylase-associated protein family)